MHRDSCIMTSGMLSQPAGLASSLLIGDYIGMESCFDLNNNDDDVVGKSDGYDDKVAEKEDGCGGRRSDERDQMVATKGKKVNKEFPPLIPLLARTENLSSHMPWILKRYYTSDGRLILMEEKVRHHEYFRAHRSNGRLTLQLVPLDEDGDDDDFSCDEETDTIDAQHSSSADDDHEEVEPEEDTTITEEQITVEEPVLSPDSSAESPTENHSGGIGGGAAGKCMNYSSSCFLGMPPVPAIRPVHI